MKLAIYILALVTLTNAMYVPSLLQKGFTLQDDIWPSKVPQFILDIDHQWLATNKTWLSRYPDVRSAICSKESDLWTKPGTPQHALPADLLARINIDNNKYGVSRFGWKNAAERLREIKNCPAALRDVMILHVNVYVYESKFDTWTESSLPPKELPHLFAEVLSQLPNLETLHWGISLKSAHLFEAAFAEANVILSSVKHIIPAAYSEWLVRRCPNLESLRAGSFFDHASWNSDDFKLDYDARIALIKAMKGLPIQKIHLYTNNWMDALKAMLDVVPFIKALKMQGVIHHGSRWGSDPNILRQHLDFLRRFPNLTSLAPPHAADLGLAFDGGPGCGNVYLLNPRG